MSLVTRCPICGTMFKIVPDQLRISEGWVRCGNCTQVFDASANLQDVLAAAPAQDPPPPSDDSPAALVATVPEPDPVPAPLPSASRKLPTPPVFDDRPRTRPSSPPADAVSPSAAAMALGRSVLSDAHDVPRRELAASPADSDTSAPVPVPPDTLRDGAHTDDAGPQGHRPVTSAGWRPVEPTFDLKLPPAVTKDEPGDHEMPGTVADLLGETQAVEPMPSRPAESSSELPRSDATHRGKPSASSGGADVADMDSTGHAQGGPESSVGSVVEGGHGASIHLASTGAGESTEERAADVRESTLQAMQFVQQARRKAFWAQPAVQALGWIGCLVMVLALLLQVLIVERDRVAATYPNLKPGLETLCASLGCEVRPYRRIEAIAIESSAFDRTRTDEFQFSIAMRNRSTLALAMPHLELTLTDARDRVLARRIFASGDLGAAAVMGPRAEWSTSQAVVLGSAASPSLVAGYRLVAFYP